MSRIAAVDRAADRHAERKKERDRKRALRSPRARARRVIVLKVVVCVLLLAVFASLGFVVGDAEYHATLIGWVPSLMMLTGIALSGLYTVALRYGITFEENTDATDCQRDSDVGFTVKFRNATPLLATRLTAYFYISDMFGNKATEASTTMSLSPREVFDLSFNARFEHIGTYQAGVDRVVASDFIGLFQATIVNPTRRFVEVTPKILELAEVDFGDDSTDEATKSSKSVIADSMDYAQVREYEPGDPLKTIHWKLSARTEGYMTRLYEVYTNPGVSIIMDFYGPSDESQDLMAFFDAVVESAFSIGRYARREGLEVDIFYRSRDGEDKRLVNWDEENLAEVMADLPRASNDPERAEDAQDILRKQIGSPHGQGNLVMCSANVGAQMAATILEAKIRRRSPSLVAVVPSSLVGKEREDYCSALTQLETAGVGYKIIARSDELATGEEV